MNTHILPKSNLLARFKNFARQHTSLYASSQELYKSHSKNNFSLTKGVII